MIFDTNTSESRQNAANAVLSSPEGYLVDIRKEIRTPEQNKLMWAALTDISKQVEWHGRFLTAENWKDVLSAALVKADVVPGIDGGFVVLGQRTSKMNKEQFGELVDLIYAFGSQNGVHWSDQDRIGLSQQGS
tara:strand:- start:368 stop:766 length:399 start_codon:yes stop_codon:yes gene_type:complete